MMYLINTEKEREKDTGRQLENKERRKDPQGKMTKQQTERRTRRERKL